jgi:HSP20 family protein
MASPAVRSSNTHTQTLRWDPFRDFDSLFDQLGRWTDSVVWSPLADVSETDEQYLIELDLPGVRRDDVTVDLTGTTLAITGELEQAERAGVFHRRARRTGRFAYRVTLPRDVAGDAIEASMADGVLTVRVPKSEAAKPRRITIS